MKSILYLLTMSIVAISSVPAQATTVVMTMSLDEMIAEAELIVEGTVVDVESQWSTDQKTIYTYVTLNNLRVLHGQVNDDTLRIRFSRGKVGGTRITIAGTPSFAPGDREILFIQKNNFAVSPVIGFFQGRFHVVNDQVQDFARTPIVKIHEGAFVKLIEQQANPSANSQQRLIGLPGIPLDRTYSYGKGGGERVTQGVEASSAEAAINIYPPLSTEQRNETSAPSHGVALPPPSLPDVTMLDARKKSASVFLKADQDTGQRLSVEEFVSEIRERLSRR